MQPLTPWLPVWHKLESRFPPRYISPFTTLHLKSSQSAHPSSAAYGCLSALIFLKADVSVGARRRRSAR